MAAALGPARRTRCLHGLPTLPHMHAPAPDEEERGVSKPRTPERALYMETAEIRLTFHNKVCQLGPWPCTVNPRLHIPALCLCLRGEEVVGQQSRLTASA